MIRVEHEELILSVFGEIHREDVMAYDRDLVYLKALTAW